MTNIPLWTVSWDSFVELVNRLIKQGATQDNLCEHFGGHQIEWRGRIESINVDGLAPRVMIALPEKSIMMNDGTIAILDGLGVPISDNAIELWKDLPIGRETTFKALLGSATSPFPPIEITKLGNERSVIFIRVCDAVPSGST